MRSAMCAASQLPGKGPLMWMMLLHLHVTQKSDYDDDMKITLCITGNFSCFCYGLLTFYKNNIFKKFFQEHYQNVK